MWNPSTGRKDIDEMVWFDFVHTDAKWQNVPDEAPARPSPSRCYAR